MTTKTNLLAGVAMSAAERATGRYMRAPDEHPAPAPAPAPAAEAPPADAAPPAAEPTSEQAFDAAFAEHAAEPLPDAVIVPPGGQAPAPAPTPSPAPDAAPAAPAAPAASDPAPAPAATPSTDEIVKGLADLLGKQPAASAPAAPAAPDAPAAPEPPMYTQAEQETLDSYRKNWPDVSAGFELQMRPILHDVFKYVFGEVQNKVVSPMVAMQEQLRTMGNVIHTQQVAGLVPDYKAEEEEAVGTWVETQPDYLRDAYKQVMQTGTSEQVADLIGRYRAASGVAPAPAAPAAPTAPAAPAPAAPAAPGRATELSEAAKQAAGSLAPVSSERTNVDVSGDLTGQDFDSAFKRFATGGT